MVDVAAAAPPAALEAAAFQRLYPEAFQDRFLSEGIRTDGRPLGQGRPVSIGPGAVGSRQGSALVKLGATSVLAGALVSLTKPSEEAPGEGALACNVEAALFSSSDAARARQSQAEMVSVVSQRLVSSMARLGLRRQLCIKPGRGAYSVVVDAYILNADGCVFDAVLLATLAALQDLALPPTKEQQEGAEGGGSGTGGVRLLTDEELQASGTPPLHLQFPVLPLAVTCCMYKTHLLVDPTAEEEAVAGSSTTVVVDASGSIHGVFMSGGAQPTDPMTFSRCIESAKLRYKALAAQMRQALQPRAGDGGDEEMGGS